MDREMASVPIRQNLLRLIFVLNLLSYQLYRTRIIQIEEIIRNKPLVG